MNKLYKRISATLLLMLAAPLIFSQIVGTSAFLQGDYTEIAVGPNGAYLSSETPPAGYHFNTTGISGLVSDAGMDGWETGDPAYCGDYFAPGSPVEGFAVQIDSNVYNNFFYVTDIPGSITSYVSAVPFIKATWQGSIMQEGIKVKQVTKIIRNSTYVVTTVVLTNTNDYDLHNVYYSRSTDPDNEEAINFDFTTNNLVLFQHPDNGFALVTATGLSYGCYLGLGSMKAGSKVAYGGFDLTAESPKKAYVGSGPFHTEGSATSDEAITLTFRLATLAANSSKSFAFTYSTNSGDAGLRTTVTDGDISEALAENFSVYPNPSAGDLNIVADQLNKDEATFTITSLSGQVINTFTQASFNGNIIGSVKLPDDVPNGIYSITMRDGENSTSQMFVLNR